MVQARAALEQLRRRDKAQQQESDTMLTQDQQALAHEIVTSAESNRKVGSLSIPLSI
jgi:hypothetical protein